MPPVFTNRQRGSPLRRITPALPRRRGSRYVRYTPGLLAAISVFLIVVVNHVELLFISNMQDYMKFPEPIPASAVANVSVQASAPTDEAAAPEVSVQLDIPERLVTVDAPEIPAQSAQSDIRPDPVGSNPVVAESTTVAPNVARVLLEPASSANQPLFIVLGDGRSGAGWAMSILNQHPHVCASGSFDSCMLLPMGFTWLADDAPEKGCTYVFVRDQVRALTGTNGQGHERCQSQTTTDALGSNLARLCALVSTLAGNTTEEAILGAFIDAFASEQYLTCTCPVDTRIRGVKVVAAWARDVPLHTTTALQRATTRMIRWRRTNLWARYISQKVAEATNVWNPSSKEEKDRQLQTLQDQQLLTISIDDMFDSFYFMQQEALEADAWVVQTRASEDAILYMEHEACLLDLATCYTQMYNFLGVTAAHVTDHPDVYVPNYDRSSTDRLLTYVSNAHLVREALGANGMGPFIGLDDYEPVRHLVHAPLGQVNRMIDLFPGVQTVTMEGGDTKFSAAVPLLQQMDPRALVVISTSRGVAVHHHLRRGTAFYESLMQFREAHAALTRNRPGAVVVSASSQCCASALTHIEPGALFHENNQRRARSCMSGQGDCIWKDNDSAVLWQKRMKEMAAQLSANTTKHVYLDASLVVGTAKDLLVLIAAVDIDPTEDDRAVLTDYWLGNPDKIVLDYDQRMFGKGFDGYKSKRNIDCSFDIDSSMDDTTAGQTPVPLFSHVPRDLGCTVQASDTELHFPLWDKAGIAIDPMITHIHDLTVLNQSASGIDSHFGPEMLYVVDDKGVWASNKIRSRIANETEHFRNIPTNEMLKVAHDLLLAADPNSPRWRLLRRSVARDGFFYFGWYGDFKECNYHNKEQNGQQESIPIFTTCAIKGCNHAFPTPAYMTMIDSQKSMSRWHSVFRKFDQDYPWEKKIRKVMWRGALSENDPTKVFDSARWRLCLLTANSKHDLFDIGLVNIPVFLTDQMEIDVSKVGGLVAPISPMNDFQRYLAILDMDGNSWSSRFGTLLCYNSVAVKVEPLYVDYFYYGQGLEPWLHYIPVKADFSDLEENMLFIMDPKNEAVVKNIIAAANRWCSEHFIYDHLAMDQLDIWEAYLQKLDSDSTWSQKWQATKAKLFASDLGLELLVGPPQ